MIKLIATGRLGKDCVIKQMDGGATVINFNIAHTTKYKNREGTTVEKTIWIQCAYWTEKTGIAPYLLKGTQVLVEGEPEVDFYNHPQDGFTAIQKLRVRQIELLGKAADSQGGQGNAGGTQQRQARPSHNQQSRTAPDDIPNASDITEPIDDLPF